MEHLVTVIRRYNLLIIQTPEEEAKIKAKKQLKLDIQVQIQISSTGGHSSPMYLEVYIAMLLILLAATAVTCLKIYLVREYGPPPDPRPTFVPRPQVRIPHRERW